MKRKIMNNQFDDLAKGLAQSVTRRGALPLGRVLVCWLAVATALTVESRGNDFRLGPQIQISGDSPFIGCDPGGFLAGPFADNVETEPYVAVNPANAKNIAAVWAV